MIVQFPARGARSGDDQGDALKSSDAPAATAIVVAFARPTHRAPVFTLPTDDPYLLAGAKFALALTSPK